MAIFKGFFSSVKETPLEKAIGWVKKYRIPGGGIPVHHSSGQVTQEVTGYLIPSLYEAGEKELAVELAIWLASVQQPDGSFLAPSGGKYTFDTAQIMRGFLSVIRDRPELKENLRLAANYVCSQIDSAGFVHTDSYSAWRLKDGSTFSNYCDLYVLPPLLEAGRFFSEPLYTNAAYKALARFRDKKDLVEFKPKLGTLSHIFGYMMEALVDLGQFDLAQKGLDQAESIQHKNGAVPAYPGAGWICPTGVAQLAVAWFKAGNIQPAKKAFDFLQRIQNPSGGFYGSHGFGGKYFPGKEISWAVKFFIDACYWNVKSSFDKEIEILEHIQENDGRVREILDFMNPVNSGKILDLGCGKGRYLSILKKAFPLAELHGVDIAQSLLEYCPAGVNSSCGSMLNIPYQENNFDGVFSVEALEHSVLIENAVREMSRVLKPGGRIVVIDKNIKRRGAMRILNWEKWFEPQEVVDLFKKSGVNMQYKYIDGGKYSKQDQLFILWAGLKEG